MPTTRSRKAAQQSLFRALAGRDSTAALQLIEAQRRAGPGFHVIPEWLTSLHLAAAAGCSEVLGAIVKAGVSVNSTLPWPGAQPQWVVALRHMLLTPEQRAALLPGMSALAVAARLGHLPCVRRLLELGADANLVGPPREGPAGVQPFTPLSAAVLRAGPGQQAAATRGVVDLLLHHGADPLAPAVRRRCSTLRCACGSEFLPNGALPLLLAHLERQHAAGRLALGSGEQAAEVMVGAARCAREQLFAVAHEYVLAAAGLRRRRDAKLAAAAAARSAARRPAWRSGLEEEPQQQEEEVEEVPSTPIAAASSDGGGGGWDAGFEPGLDAGPATAAPPPWQPSPVQLFEALRGAALGGSPAILRAILASPLPFSVAQADAAGNGLMAHSAAHAGCAEAIHILHRAGAQLTLRRLLYVLEKGVAAGAVAALLACQRPPVPPDTATLKAAGVVSFSCPIHRLLHIWKRHQPGQDPGAAADAARERNVMLVLEELVSAGYRPAVYSGLRHPMVMAHDGALTPVTDPFDPFEYFPVAGPADSRFLLVARQGAWDTAAHAIWPDRFKAAVRGLLLAARHGDGARSGGRPAAGTSRAARAARCAARAAGAQAPAGGASLAALPQELVLQVAAQAAWPMSAWV